MLASIRRRIYNYLTLCNRAYFTRLGVRKYNPDGINIFQADWDSLVLMDACRYDALERYAQELPGRLNSRISRGSMTIEFLEANLTDRDLLDTVYVTATPQFSHFRDKLRTRFHAIINIWADDENLWTAPDGRKAVLPKTVTEFAIKANERYPGKRLLIHYTQPHLPFINPANDTLADPKNIYRMKYSGKLDVHMNEIRRAYFRNLRRAIPHVADLMNTLEGKTVVSADHGELLGERGFPIPVRMWGHPHGVYLNELVRVPWLVYENGRREITSEPLMENQIEPAEEVVEDHLENLGYIV
jgi:hypothetical protein